MRLLSVAFIMAFLAASSLQAMNIVEPYRSGERLCSGPGNVLDTMGIKEFGFFADVPIDYSNPRLGTTKIYAWTIVPFDPSKKTVIFFAGGPGGSSHWDVRGTVFAPDWNFVYFDQRGITCSRPATKELIANPLYYGSESTARDANEIRKHLGIEKWSAYGHSYGTIPATIAGHLFPDSVQAVVLEGVVYSGDEVLGTGQHRLKILQRYFDKLAPDMREKVRTYSRHPELPRYWFSDLAQGAMYLNFPLRSLSQTLTELFALSEDAMIMEIKGRLRSWSDMMADVEFGASGWAFVQLTCKELGGSNEFASLWAEFKEGKLTPSKESPVKANCEEIGVVDSPAYQAITYPLAVPTTYFLGGLDGATEVTTGIRHWKDVPKGKAQLLIAPNGGHIPTFAITSEAQKAMVPIFQSALEGIRIDPELIRASNAVNELIFTYADRF